MKIKNTMIFLDFDGVLNGSGATRVDIVKDTMTYFDQYNVDIFKSLLEKLDSPKIIINTSWRRDFCNGSKKHSKLFFQYCFDVFGLDPELIFAADKFTQDTSMNEKIFTINKYMKLYPDLKHLIIDDFDLNYLFPDIHCITNTYVGLTNEKVIECINILNR